MALDVCTEKLPPHTCSKPWFHWWQSKTSLGLNSIFWPFFCNYRSLEKKGPTDLQHLPLIEKSSFFIQVTYTSPACVWIDDLLNHLRLLLQCQPVASSTIFVFFYEKSILIVYWLKSITPEIYKHIPSNILPFSFQTDQNIWAYISLELGHSSNFIAQCIFMQGGNSLQSPKDLALRMKKTKASNKYFWNVHTNQFPMNFIRKTLYLSFISGSNPYWFFVYICIFTWKACHNK